MVIATVSGLANNYLDQWAAGYGFDDEGFDYSSFIKDGVKGGLTALVTGGIAKGSGVLSGLEGGGLSA